MRERKTSFPIFTIFCVSQSSGHPLKEFKFNFEEWPTLEKSLFFFAYFLLTNFYYYYFYSSVYFIFKEKEMSLNDYIFLFCLFFHLPPQKIEL